MKLHLLNVMGFEGAGLVSIGRTLVGEVRLRSMAAGKFVSGPIT